ncbi:MAG: SWIM zinc finger family protein, partial [Pirellula sp.]
AEAAKNGRTLVLKKKYLQLNISGDSSILFGECQGSGKDPYRCSCDFIRPGAPTYRCSCPSRQFPCKHSIGLMYAYVQNASSFKTAEVPEDLQSKREKVVARAERSPCRPKAGQ